MRLRSTVVLALTAAFACAAGPALAAVAGHAPSPNASQYTGTSPQTLSQTTTTATSTSTTSTGTTTTTTTPASPNVDVCLASGSRAIARHLGVRVANIRIRPSQGNNGMPQCSYRVNRPRKRGPHTRAVVLVNVDSGPQALWRLMRTVVEASQLFGPAPPGWHAPIGLLGLGPYAAWFINRHALMAVNHTHTQLLEASVVWRRAKRAEMIGLARSVIVAYIHAPATGHPIGPGGY